MQWRYKNFWYTGKILHPGNRIYGVWGIPEETEDDLTYPEYVYDAKTLHIRNIIESKNLCYFMRPHDYDNDDYTSSYALIKAINVLSKKWGYDNAINAVWRWRESMIMSEDEYCGVYVVDEDDVWQMICADEESANTVEKCIHHAISTKLGCEDFEEDESLDEYTKIELPQRGQYEEGNFVKVFLDSEIMLAILEGRESVQSINIIKELCEEGLYYKVYTSPLTLLKCKDVLIEKWGYDQAVKTIRDLHSWIYLTPMDYKVFKNSHSEDELQYLSEECTGCDFALVSDSKMFSFRTSDIVTFQIAVS